MSQFSEEFSDVSPRVSLDTSLRDDYNSEDSRKCKRNKERKLRIATMISRTRTAYQGW